MFSIRSCTLVISSSLMGLLQETVVPRPILYHQPARRRGPSPDEAARSVSLGRQSVPWGARSLPRGVPHRGLPDRIGGVTGPGTALAAGSKREGVTMTNDMTTSRAGRKQDHRVSDTIRDVMRPIPQGGTGEGMISQRARMMGREGLRDRHG